MTPQSNELVNSMNTQYSHDQLSYFKHLCARVNHGQISMNQAYKAAKQTGTNVNSDGEQENTPGGFKGSFNLWVQHAVDKGWIQQGAQIFEGAKSNLEETGSIIKRPEDEKNRKEIAGKIVAWTLIVGAVAFTAYTIYKNRSKQ